MRSKHLTKSSLLEPLFHAAISSYASTAPFKRSRVACLFSRHKSSKDISFIYKRSYECDVLKVNARICISLRIVVVLALSVYKKVSVELHCLTLFFEAILCERTPVSGGWLCQSLLIRVIVLLERLSASNDLCK